MLFKDLAELARKLEGLKSRTEKVSILAQTLRGLSPEEGEVAIRLLTGRVFPEYSEANLGVGWSLLSTAYRNVKGSPALFLRQLTVNDVYKRLSEIAEATGEDSRKRKLRLLQALLANMDKLEFEYFIRFITGEPRIGANEGIVLEALAKVANVDYDTVRRAYMFTGDLGDLTKSILEGARLEEITLQLFRPVRPMLAEMASDVRRALKECGGQAALEFKYDGIRIQVHKRGKEVRLFTRRLSNVTHSLPDVVNQVTEHVHAEEAVLDSEAISFQDGKPLRFQDLVRRVRRKNDVWSMIKEMPFAIKVFDLIYLDGRVFVNEAYEARWERLLEKVDQEILIERIVTSDVEEAEKFYRESVEKGNEGLVVKNLRSPYTPGVRGRYWFKVKPAETIDLVIVGAERGHGRRSRWYSDYYLAVLDVKRGEYLVVGKTFKGLTDVEFEEVTRKLSELKVRDEGWRIWVKPTMVVEVAFNEIQRSPKYRSGFALRFARILRFRPDKSPQDIATLEDVKKMYEDQFKRRARVSF
ncbi:MAG: ATP-dependent DNA ligase [Thermofilaceae archaeon]